MSKKPLPFRSPKQHAAIRRGVETRARRNQLLALAKKQPSFERWTAADLEKLFWDVRDWRRAISQHHPNAPLVSDLEERIAAEYTRRRQHDPLLVGNRQAAETINRLLSGQGTAERLPPRLTLVRNDDEPGPAS